MRFGRVLAVSTLLAFLGSCCNQILPVPTKTPDNTPSPTNSSTPTPMPTATPTPIQYNIGDIGPAGGWVFYDKGSEIDGWRYLEAAPVDQLRKAWGTFNYTVNGADGTAIGTGEQNTLEIIAGDSSTVDKAAEACANYSTVNNGITYDDWFLPSKDELNAMYLNLQDKGIGGFTESSYWTSSEGLPTDARGQFFSNGTQSFFFKDATMKSRPARKF